MLQSRKYYIHTRMASSVPSSLTDPSPLSVPTSTISINIYVPTVLVHPRDIYIMAPTSINSLTQSSNQASTALSRAISSAYQGGARRPLESGPVGPVLSSAASAMSTMIRMPETTTAATAASQMGSSPVSHDRRRPDGEAFRDFVLLSRSPWD